MTNLIKLRFNVIQLCEVAHLSAEFIGKSVELGIVSPSGSGTEEWLFDAHQLKLLRKAARLRRDLELDWNGLALAIDLIEELDQLRQENKIMKNRLNGSLSS